MHDEEEVQVVRKFNRVLRKSNQRLRGINQKLHEYSDNLFMELCEIDCISSEALERIRQEGDIDCDPDDYELIIFECLKALKLSKSLSVSEKQ